MSKLDRKLREVKNKRARREFLEQLSNDFSVLLNKVDFSHDVNCLKYGAFSTWDMKNDCQTTTRGKIDSWEIEHFKTFTELVNTAKTKVSTSIIPGWFFIDTDGPYFSISLAEFILNLDNLVKYSEETQHFDFGWIGKDQDMGVVFEFNHTSFCRNELELCTWGI